MRELDNYLLDVVCSVFAFTLYVVCTSNVTMNEWLSE